MERINGVWQTGNCDPLYQIFHQDAVVTLVDIKHQAQGRESCIQMWDSMMREMTARSMEFGPQNGNLWGDTAITNQRIDNTFLLEGHRYTETANADVVFSRSSGKWQSLPTSLCEAGTLTPVSKWPTVGQ